MTIEETKQKLAELTGEIERLVREFENATSCQVHSIDLTRQHIMSSATGPVFVSIEVRLP